MEEDYAGICGITQSELEANFQPEIQVLADKQQLEYDQAVAALKQWYDGYLFHPAGEGMYNPYSLLNAFVKKEIKSYWFSTGTPTFLVNYLKDAHYFIPDLDGNVELNEEGLQTEVHCATGRADAVVTAADTIYIFEFKLSGNGSAEDAIKQIHKQKYAVQYKTDGKKIVLIDSSFDEQARTIKDWKTEVL